MIDFEEKENQIKAFIEENFPDYISGAELEQMDAYIDDFLDFDKYKQNKKFFYNFSTYDFNDLSNESNSATFNVSFYIVLKGEEAGTLRSNLLKYAAAFYKMFEKSGNNLNGIFDFGKIDTVNFYNAAEGHKELKVCSLDVTFQIEV